MIHLLMRYAGFVVLALALIVANHDVAKTLDARALNITKLGDAWYSVDSGSR